jgi:hypothetical protein
MCQLLGYRYGRKYYSPELNRMPSNATSYPPFVHSMGCFPTGRGSPGGSRRVLLRGGEDARHGRRLLSQPAVYTMDIPARAKIQCRLAGPAPALNPMINTNTVCNPGTGPLFAAVECSGALSSM